MFCLLNDVLIASKREDPFPSLGVERFRDLDNSACSLHKAFEGIASSANDHACKIEGDWIANGFVIEKVRRLVGRRRLDFKSLHLFMLDNNIIDETLSKVVFVNGSFDKDIAFLSVRDIRLSDLNLGSGGGLELADCFASFTNNQADNVIGNCYHVGIGAGWPIRSQQVVLNASIASLLVADGVARLLIGIEYPINKLFCFRNIGLRFPNNKNMRLLVALDQDLAPALRLHLLLTHTPRPYQQPDVIHPFFFRQCYSHLQLISLVPLLDSAILLWE